MTISTRCGREARDRWIGLGGDPARIELAAERAEFELPARAAALPGPPESISLGWRRVRRPRGSTRPPSARRWCATALEKARDAHAGQIRNGSGGMPYVEHPIAVAALLDEHGFGDEILAAALLHDVVEDSETTLDELRRAVRRTRSPAWSGR